jgi:hypothetical protein
MRLPQLQFASDDNLHLAIIELRLKFQVQLSFERHELLLNRVAKPPKFVTEPTSVVCPLIAAPRTG